MSKVLITGGSRGIGEACVRRFASEGYVVYFTYLNSKENAMRIASETGAVPFCCDVSDTASVEKLYSEIRGSDILVNNAGIAQIKPFACVTEDEWSNMISVNLTSAYRMCKAALPYMLSRGGGHIVNISSVWGILGASCEVHYSAAKSGLIGLTRSLAKELAPSNITVNCVAPGVIDTDMNKGLSEETVNELINEIPAGRLGNAYEVASLVYFLSCGQSDYITGQTVCCDGGFSI